jgi:hypothetical protein
MIMLALTLYELAMAANVLLVATLIIVVRACDAEQVPQRAVRALCLLAWAGALVWWSRGLPAQTWLVGYEVTVWLMLCVGCVLLWVVAATTPKPPTEPPTISQMAARTDGPLINGRKVNYAARSRSIRAKYRGKS